jgi:hypothetical protein
MYAAKAPKERLLSIDELDSGIVNLATFELLILIDDGIDDDIGILSNMINYPSAEGFFTAVKTSVVDSPPP